MPSLQPYGGPGWALACLLPPSAISLFASVLVKHEAVQQAREHEGLFEWGWRAARAAGLPCYRLANLVSALPCWQRHSPFMLGLAWPPSLSYPGSRQPPYACCRASRGPPSPSQSPLSTASGKQGGVGG